MRVREAQGRRGLVALALLALVGSCGPRVAPQDPIPDAGKTAADHRALLSSIEGRSDPEALRARARSYSWLREREDPVSAELLARGDAADVELLSLAAPPEFKEESALRLARHFRARAETAALARGSFQGPHGESLRRVVLFTIAAFYGEYVSAEEQAVAMAGLGEALQALSSEEGLSHGASKLLERRAREAAEKSAALRGKSGPPEISAEARKFCEYDADRHLREATRARDFGTREKAERSELDTVFQWYLLSLAHYSVVREVLLLPAPAQASELEAQEIVVRSLCDIFGRQP